MFLRLHRKYKAVPAHKVVWISTREGEGVTGTAYVRERERERKKHRQTDTQNLYK